MKKYEILYDWPIAQIEYLASSGVTETYASALHGENQDRFISLVEQLRGFGADLYSAKSRREHTVGWGDIAVCLDEFEQHFGNFPDAKFLKFRIFVLLSSKLSQIAPVLDTADIAADAFEFRELTQQLPLHWFCYENSQSFLDSTAVFSCSSYLETASQVIRANLSPQFIFHFLGALQSLATLPAGHVALVKKTIPQIDSAAVESFVRMLVIADGKSVHSAKRYSAVPQVVNRDAIRVGNVYQQWQEVLDVLSEYNSRDEILVKYLTIYHVVENFMFKLPIVDLEQRRNGRMFSIRDFQTLYDNTKSKEGEALKKLFSTVFPISANSTQTFKQRVQDRWVRLAPGVSEADINTALSDLGLPLTFRGFRNDIATHFSKLVYVIRNAIVHNKATEFHLTYVSLDSAKCALIELFLIPSLEEICFFLIGSPNAHLWYRNRELLLHP